MQLICPFHAAWKESGYIFLVLIPIYWCHPLWSGSRLVSQDHSVLFSLQNAGFRDDTWVASVVGIEGDQGLESWGFCHQQCPELLIAHLNSSSATHWPTSSRTHIPSSLYTQLRTSSLSWSPHRVIFFGRFSFISIWNFPSRNSSTAEGNFKTLSSTFLPSFKKYLHKQNHCIRVLCTPSGSGNFWDRQTPFADSLIWFLGQRVRPWKCRGWSIGPYARYVKPPPIQIWPPNRTQCSCSL